MELWDLYDKERKPLGKTHIRGLPLDKGEYHLVVFVWTFNSCGQVLMTKRSAEKQSYAGLWEYSGGSALAGESSLQAAQRELLEETGLSAPEDKCRLIQTVRGGCSFSHVWLFEADFDLEDVQLQKEETSGKMLCTPEEILRMEREGTLAPCGDLRDFFLKAGEKL